MAKVSIIIPVYNTEKYLAKTIESLIEQTFHDCEFILVNDGSTDNSLAICNHYSLIDDRIVVISQSNQGVSAARNAGIAIANGDYIGFVDSDDIIRQDYVEKLYLNSFGKDVVMCGACRHNDETGEDKPLALGFDENCITTGQRFWELFGNTYILSSANWNKLYRKELIGNIRFKTCKNAEDLLFNYEVIKNDSSISVITEQLYFYYLRQGSASQINDFLSIYNDALVRLEVIKKLRILNSSADNIFQAVYPLMNKYYRLKKLDPPKESAKEVKGIKKQIIIVTNCLQVGIKKRVIILLFKYNLLQAYNYLASLLKRRS